jgi:serine phosphatase RsbU (regulator of sigma subunit)
MKTKKQKIARSFQKWLLILAVFAFLATTAFLWIFQTALSKNNAVSLLKLNIADVRQDIVDASDANLLKLTHQIAHELDTLDALDQTYDLFSLAEKYGVSEINRIDKNGIIIASTYPHFLNYVMASGAQSAEFLVLFEGETEHVQSYQPVSYDASLSRKYAGVVLKDGGFVQVGYDADRFQNDIAEQVKGVTRNRHIGEGGCILIADENWNIVSDRYGNEGKNLDVTGLWIDTETMLEGEYFVADVYGEPCYCVYHISEGFCIVAVIPRREAALSRNVSVAATTVMEIIVFASLFFIIYFLVKKLVVDNIRRVNDSLSEIADGKLETVVDVRSHMEFDVLSNDINATVDTLKRYIADAAARIDAELAFAKAIQHSALPSIFPPYPNRKDIDIFASMDTAKEVGGDFYDFYFIDDDHLAFLIADVSDKGIPAAMFMMTSKTLLKSLAESGMAVSEVFTEANEKLSAGNEAGMFVTAWMGILDMKTGVVTYANAGHNPPLVRHADGSFEYLRSRAGFVLAGMEGIRYRKQELQLEKGDTLYLYTDGVTEAANIENALFGEERLQNVLNENRDGSPEELLKAVTASLRDFVGEAAQSDDITMLALQYKGDMLL